MGKLIGNGAEAEIYLKNNNIIKVRPKKGYRITEIDENLRKSRTKKEYKILNKLRKAEINVPQAKISEDKYKINLEYIEGKTIKNVLQKNIECICSQIGNNLGQIHKLDIIHGDLTTSNMILKNKTVYFIDFGLSIVSKRIEDKAVDIHLLKQALDSYHCDHSQECYLKIIENYKKANPHSDEILKRLKQVEGRGRNKP